MEDGKIKIYDMPDVVANLIETAYNEYTKEKQSKYPELRPYQKEAIEFLEKNNFIELSF